MFLLSSFFFGLLAAIGALLTELTVFSFFIRDTALQSVPAADANFVFATGGMTFLFLSAFIEETFKFLLLKKTVFTEQRVWKMIAALALFGIGFSSLETLLLFLSTPHIDTNTALHIVSIFLLHLSTITALGYTIIHPPLKRFSFIVFPLMILIHFIYNISVLQ